jgi:hypothetical protein
MMTTLGTKRERQEVPLSDTAELRPYLYNDDETPVPAALISGVSFQIKKPDGTVVTVAGTVPADGSGFLHYDGVDQKGLYIWTAQFTLVSGEKRTQRGEFNAYDPLEIPPQTRKNKIAEEVWLRLEDCFDSDLGGPWLREMTLSYFDPTKVERFIDEGLVYVNGWPPLTNFGLEMFTTQIPSTDPNDPAGTEDDDPDQIIIIQATLLAVIRHLMRSYTEQELPVGANIVWQNRRDYLERWNTIYQLELQWFKEMVALWKRQFFNYGRSSLLVGQKAGRLGYGTGWRARNVLRGF